MNILKVSIVVKSALVNAPESRDSDELLILKVWAIQKPELRDNKSFTFRDFSILFKDKKLFSTESIRRSRQKIQEEIEGLRGDNYKSRHKHQNKVKGDLKELSMIKAGTP